MSANKELQALLAQRELYLQRAIALVEGDRRVVAAWLYGSLGRGTSDEWSDIDLWLAVDDSHIDEIGTGRREYAAQLGEPLLIVDAPQNAPPGGAFLSVLYKGQVGSQHIDWTWQAASDVRIPQDAKLLFNRGEVPHADPRPPQSAEEQTGRAKKQATFFWMMVPVVAKYIVRRQSWAALDLLNLLRYTLDEVSYLSEQADEPPVHTNKSSTPPPVQPADQLAMLTDMVRQMERLMSDIEGLRDVVSTQAQEQIGRYLRLASTVLAQ